MKKTKYKTGARQEADTMKAQNNTKTYQATTRSNAKKEEKREKCTKKRGDRQHDTNKKKVHSFINENASHLV